MRGRGHNGKFVHPKYTISLKYMSKGWDTQKICIREFLEREKGRGREEREKIPRGLNTIFPEDYKESHSSNIVE